MKMLAIMALVLVLLVAAWFAFSPPRAMGDVVPSGSVGARIEDEPTDPNLAPVSEVDGIERSQLTGPEAPAAVAPQAATLLAGSGALRVTILWSDGDLAAGVGVVAASPWEGPTGVRLNLRAVAADDGVALIPEIPPGSYKLRTDRSADGDDDVSVEVSAGETTESTVTLPDGIDVAGRVVDSKGSPIADAGIWLSSRTGRWTGGSIAAHSDAGGRFELRDLPEGPSLGAIAAGYLPSSLVDLDLVDTASNPVSIELVVTRGGGSLEGRVSDEEGRGIEGVVVVLGDTSGGLDMRFDSTIEEKWSARYATSDADGHYWMAALATGTEPLRARRLGLPQWSGEVTIVAGEATRQDIVIRPGARLSGTVTDTAGEPVANARIQAFDQPLSEAFLQNGQIDYDGAFAQLVTLSDDDGTYVLDHLPRGTVYVYALAPRPASRGRGQIVQFTKATFDFTEVTDRTWDPVLSDGRVISGAVRYGDGEPITGIFVSVTSEQTGRSDHRALYTESGEFKFIQLPSESYSVSAQIWELPEGKVAPREDGVVPGGDPVELVADFDSPVEHPKGSVRVRFLDSGHRAAGATAVAVSLERLDRFSWRIGTLEGDDVWVFNLDSPGRFRPIALLGERLIAVGEPFDYTAGTDIDLGTFASGPGGTLSLRFTRSEEHPPENARLHLRHDAYRRGENIDVGNEPVLRLESMEPGTGTFTLRGKNFESVEMPYEIRAGEETALDISLVPAVRVPYRIELPSFEESTSIDIRFVDLADGSFVREVHYKDARVYSTPIEWTLSMSPGSYRLEVELGDGRRGETLFDVTSLDPSVAPNPTLTIE